ncbi:MAG: LysM peptidoglycan-binding domain-containing protein [Lachnoclostridium edouardi]|uniref:CIS tube protein n=1 Tax=Lachnoclostridium edouardi TaxID=1926283 RepID=UPI0026DD2A95|nr:LysM peptidoglycan-binding domain-containing protein [Lachnoclostridium edouardi]MDO4278935.1 LysM peptidoglycan-binding domain-containing protein [Lachnoclostridium edouardi]
MRIIGALEKAQIIIHGEYADETIKCSINPSQYVLKNSVSYKEDTDVGSDVSRLVFLSGGKSELSLTLYFDSANDSMENGLGIASNLTAGSTFMLPPVTDKTEKIKKAIKVEGGLHKPPLISFQWGNLDFKGAITSMTETFTMFNTFGKPIRSKMDLTMKAVEEPSFTRMVNPFQSPDRTKCRTIVEGTSLWSIAYEEYGDCEMWRVIAKANGLMSPLDIKAGQVIKVPAI